MSNRTASQAVQGAEQCPTEEAAGLVGGTTERIAAAAIATAREEDERQSYSGRNKGVYRSLDVSSETGTQER